MANIIKLSQVRRTRAQGKTLCRAGFHKWKILTKSQFDVREGKLVTRERCERCSEMRTRLK